MIPKKIHYCWFGGKELPESARKCIASWKKFFPDHEITEWNEQNFDVREIPYTAAAYDAGKYAFVSDYARFKILHDHGGVYFDTDVEAIRPFDDILASGAFMGVEVEPTADTPMMVNPGLGIAAEAGDPIYGEVLDVYRNLSFFLPDGSINMYAVVRITTDVLKANGMEQKQGIQTVKGITVYPSSYFNPLDDATGRLNITPDTRSIHWFTKSWMKVNPWRQRLSRLIHRVFGVTSLAKIKQLFK